MAKDPAILAHQEWLGYVQPVGLVVSIPAMLDANGLALGQELDTEFIQLVEHLEEVLGIASQAVACPYEDDIEATPMSILQHSVE